MWHFGNVADSKSRPTVHPIYNKLDTCFQASKLEIEIDAKPTDADFMKVLLSKVPAGVQG